MGKNDFSLLPNFHFHLDNLFFNFHSMFFSCVGSIRFYYSFTSRMKQSKLYVQLPLFFKTFTNPKSKNFHPFKLKIAHSLPHFIIIKPQFLDENFWPILLKGNCNRIKNIYCNLRNFFASVWIIILSNTIFNYVVCNWWMLCAHFIKYEIYRTIIKSITSSRWKIKKTYPFFKDMCFNDPKSNTFLPTKEVAVGDPQHDEEKDEEEEESSWQEIQNSCGHTKGNTGDIWHRDSLLAQSERNNKYFSFSWAISLFLRGVCSCWNVHFIKSQNVKNKFCLLRQTALC